MYFISHRGNIRGSKPKKENTNAYIKSALEAGYDVEIDVWYLKPFFYLGHDEPKERIVKGFLNNNKLWCHAKNIECLNELIKQPLVNCFWHENDKVAITSKGYLWCHSDILNLDSRKSIVVMPELNSHEPKSLKGAGGICSDNIEEYKKELFVIPKSCHIFPFG